MREQSTVELDPIEITRQKIAEQLFGELCTENPSVDPRRAEEIAEKVSLVLLPLVNEVEAGTLPEFRFTTNIDDLEVDYYHERRS